MPIIIQSKQRTQSVTNIPDLNIETNIINLPNQIDDYVIEGCLDLSALTSDDTVFIREYIAVDGTNQRILTSSQYTGVLSEPIIRFPAKIIPLNGKYRVTVTQTSGIPVSIPYYFIVEIMGEI